MKKLSVFIILSVIILFGFKGTISLNIEEKSDYLQSKNQYIQPTQGNKFIGYLVSITNNGDKNLFGGTCGYNSYFEIVTGDGYIIKANNIGTALRDNRVMWCADEIPPGETRRGWIIFSVPVNVNIQYLIFNASEITGPQQGKILGKVKIKAW